MNRKLLIVGCGDLGCGLAETLLADGVDIWGLRRNASLLPPGIRAIQADLCQPDTLKPLVDMDFDAAVVTLTPGGFAEEHYRKIFVEGLANLLRVLNTRFMIFVSSSSVYHQADGEWVDEESATEPLRFSGRALLQAEALVRESKSDSVVVRFAGIYGPGRRRLLQQVLEGKGSPPVYSNRIHREDCIGFLAHLLGKHWRGEELEPLYLATDSEPVLLPEVKIWLARRLGIDPASLKGIANKEVAKNRRGSKRCNNKRMLASAYQLRYPDFRKGYEAVLAEEKSLYNE